MIEKTFEKTLKNKINLNRLFRANNRIIRYQNDKVERIKEEIALKDKYSLFPNYSNSEQPVALKIKTPTTRREQKTGEGE